LHFADGKKYLGRSSSHRAEQNRRHLWRLDRP
jgi:hypothetical protein